MASPFLVGSLTCAKYGISPCGISASTVSSHRLSCWCGTLPPGMERDGHQMLQEQRRLDDELVPLAVAAQVAYSELARIHEDPNAEGLGVVVHLTAIALSQLAPILHVDGHRLTDEEIRRVFILTPDVLDVPLDLDSFRIRRGDFRQALTTLQEARATFGGTDGC
jgi:hypothetical protein